MVIPWSNVQKLAPMSLGFFPCFSDTLHWGTREEKQIIGDIPIKLHTEILWLGEPEDHRGVVLQITLNAFGIWTNPHRSLFA